LACLCQGVRPWRGRVARGSLGLTLSPTMFKKVVGFEAVPHRMGGLAAKRDPLMDEKVGSAKRHKASDGSDRAYYKETAQEKKARLAAQKSSEKAQLAASKEADRQEAVSSKAERQAGKAKIPNTAVKDVLGSFKSKLKSSSLPDEAAQAERKHKDEIRAEEAEALAKSSSSSSAPSAAAAGPAPAEGKGRGKGDVDEKITFSEIWQEGDEESAADWLGGGGLKFHTTADKAFSMDARRLKDSTERRDVNENSEAAAERNRKRGEMRMEEFRRNQKG